MLRNLGNTMKIKHYLTILAVALTVQANADNYRDMEPLTLEVPEMKAELVELSETSNHLDLVAPSASPKMDDLRRHSSVPGRLGSQERQGHVPR